MQLNLTDSQVNALILAIDSYYSDLREEIYHTDDYDMRQSLKDVESALGLIRDQLEPGWLARAQAELSNAEPEATPPPSA
jgi:hypothetical protein